MAKVVITLEEVSYGNQAAIQVSMLPGIDAIERAQKADPQGAHRLLHLTVLGLADALAGMASKNVRKNPDSKLYLPN